MPEKKEKPKIEDIIKNNLNGDEQKNALSFVEYLRDKKLNPQWSAANAWKVTYKSFTVCFIRLHGCADYHNLDKGTWHILPFIGDYEKNVLSDNDKDIVWENKKKCKVCGQCALKLSKIFGREFVNACEGSILFINPDCKAIECAKKLVILRVDDIRNGNAKKHKYIAVKDR